MTLFGCALQKVNFWKWTACLLVTLARFFSRLLIFFKINFFEKLFQVYRQSVEQFGSRSGPTFCRAWLQRFSADDTRRQRVKNQMKSHSMSLVAFQNVNRRNYNPALSSSIMRGSWGWGRPDPLLENHIVCVSIVISKWTPLHRKKLDPLPLKILDTPLNLGKL